jgi:ubiquinone/menaquinone biosynthesis C-methylase UbiE
MSDGHDRIAKAFDQRSARYGRNQWHRAYAEAFVALAPLQPGQRVLDAGTGTGFAALAIAARVAPGGRVVAADISAGMLERARIAVAEAGASSIEFIEADATSLPAFPDGSFDVVLSSAALLYMPVDRALREWRRLLTPGGHVGFSTMRAGFPAAGQLFRACAAEYGLSLSDPSEPLGSEERCCDVLEAAGFKEPSVLPGQVTFSPEDLEMAWESNLRSANHLVVQSLNDEQQAEMRRLFETARLHAQADDPAFNRADVLFAFARR